MDVCFYFQVHQPMRLRKFSLFDSHPEDSFFARYFDANLNDQIMRKVTEKCYLPTNALLLELLEKHPDFHVSFSLTGVFMEQCKLFAPEVLDSFRSLAKTGRVDFLSETYYHSLSSLFANKQEFIEQVGLHKETLFKEFGVTPRVFRNTEALYNNEIAALVESMGYAGMMTEGLDHILGWRSPNYVYAPKGGQGKLKVLLRNYRLSDDVGYRFSQKSWNEWPLTADKYANWLAAAEGDCINLFMDYETFGEHHWEDTGIRDFLRHLPAHAARHPHLRFATPAQVADQHPAKDQLDIHTTISWADMERDASAWLGNDMQRACFRTLEELEPLARAAGKKNKEALHAWRLLQNSDHLYYLSTKSLSDQDVHNYFSPYDGPFEAFINYMNILQDYKERAQEIAGVQENAGENTQDDAG